MTHAPAQLGRRIDGCDEQPDALSHWREQLRDAGLVAVACDPNGKIISRPRPGADWLADLLLRSPIVQQAIKRAVNEWKVESGNVESGKHLRFPLSTFPLSTLAEAFPGCWFVGLPVLQRRRVVRVDVVIILTGEIGASEQLRAMCQAGESDFELVRKRIDALPPAGGCDVKRLAGLVRLSHEAAGRVRADAWSMQSLSQQLGESYEEINLLYTIIRSMTVVQQPERFVAGACEELLATLPYRWVGAQLADSAGAAGASHLSGLHQMHRKLRGRLIVAGELPAGVSLDELQRVAMSLLASGDGKARADEPIVLEPGANSAHEAYAALGRTVAIHPVSRDEQVIGLLIAGEKREDAPGGPAVSSMDVKLLGATATHMAIFLENAALYDDLNAMFLGTLEALSASIDAKDRYTCGHSQRVAHLAVELGRAAGLDAAALNRLRIAGLVHDVGKIGVPERVLTKPGRLSAEEFDWIRRHPEIGHRILRDIPQLKDVLPAVLHHHERWDGTGYPHGLAGQEIPFIARLIALADAFDAMSSDRAYRASLTRPDVLKEIRRCAGTQFDPTLAVIFVSLNFQQYDEMMNEHRAAELLAKRGAA